MVAFPADEDLVTAKKTSKKNRKKASHLTEDKVAKFVNGLREGGPPLGHPEKAVNKLLTKVDEATRFIPTTEVDKALDLVSEVRESPSNQVILDSFG